MRLLLLLLLFSPSFFHVKTNNQEEGLSVVGEWEEGACLSVRVYKDIYSTERERERERELVMDVAKS